MKKLLFTLFLFSFFQISFSQVSADTRLSVRFSSTELTAMETAQHTELKMWNYYVKNSYVVYNNIGVKANQYPLLSSIVATNPTTNLPYDVSNQTPTNSTTFNPFYYSITLKNNAQTYKIGAGSIVVFLDKETFIKNFNTTL